MTVGRRSRPRRRSGPIQLTRDGIISGGVCDEEHQRRRARERGGSWLLNEAYRRFCIVKSGRCIRVRGIPRFATKELWGIGRRHGYSARSAEYENGVYRALDVLRELRNAGVTLSAAKLEKAIEDKQAGLFSLGALLASGDGVVDAQQPAIYEARKARGEFI